MRTLFWYNVNYVLNFNGFIKKEKFTRPFESSRQSGPYTRSARASREQWRHQTPTTQTYPSNILGVTHGAQGVARSLGWTVGRQIGHESGLWFQTLFDSREHFDFCLTRIRAC